jgi:hypothetical protein
MKRAAHAYLGFTRVTILAPLAALNEVVQRDGVRRGDGERPRRLTA